jgi:superfamily II DNA or RNA helicase
MARRFGGRQRVALFLMAQGRCERCGVPLQPGWHADHIRAWSHGGETDVMNGQALCPTCNERKGAGMPSVHAWPESVALRPWQVRALEEFTARGQRDFFAVATPGAGKTIFALRIAHRDLWEGRAERVVVVCPTEHLKTQWALAAHRCGLDLDPRWTNDRGAEAADYHGVAVTYQQVASNPAIHRLQCRRPTLVIFDEIHHAGEPLMWGDSLREAFDPAVRRLLLSGTPFRTDNHPIPYMRYDAEGRGLADFEYGYADALADMDVCRAVLFPSFEGRMDWVSGEERHSARFEDELSQRLSAERLRTALATNGEWLPTVLREADRKLSEVRQDGHPDAGGLVIAMEQLHARRIADLLLRITGQQPALVISDEPDTSGRIARFASGTERWIVAVRMVSEGVDIPRLRVGVYATNTATELFFRQAVGRFIRWLPGLENQNAYLYIPKDPVLVEFAGRILEEQRHQLEELVERIRREREGVDRDDDGPIYVPIDSQGYADDWIRPGEGPLTMAELLQAEALKRRLGMKDTPENLARLIREIAGKAAPDPVVAQPVSAPLQARKRRLRDACKRLVGVLAAGDGYEAKRINVSLKALSGKSIEDETEDELNRRLDRLTAWAEEAKHARQPIA